MPTLGLSQLFQIALTKWLRQSLSEVAPWASLMIQLKAKYSSPIQSQAQSQSYRTAQMQSLLQLPLGLTLRPQFMIRAKAKYSCLTETQPQSQSSQTAQTL